MTFQNNNNNFIVGLKYHVVNSMLYENFKSIYVRNKEIINILSHALHTASTLFCFIKEVLHSSHLKCLFKFLKFLRLERKHRMQSY